MSESLMVDEARWAQRPDTDRGWRLAPAYWPDGDELLLIVDPMTAGGADRTDMIQAVRSDPELAGWALWRGDHMEIPWNPGVTVERDSNTLTVTVGGQLWGECAMPPLGDLWHTAITCLVAIAPGVHRAPESWLSPEAECISMLERGYAVIAEVPVRRRMLPLEPREHFGQDRDPARPPKS